MKKLMIAAAALGAFAGAAQAQTSVTLYGIVDASYENVKAGDQKNSRMTSGALSGSRWGLKGTEDLGNGLKVNFQLEGGFNVDRGTLGQGERLFGRQAWVGLQGSGGEVRLGRQYTPIGNLADAVTVMGTGSYSLNCNITLNCGDDGLPLYRSDNSFMYFSPDMSGVKVQLMYATNGDGSEGLYEGDREQGRQIGGLIDYTNGPFYIGLAHNRLTYDEYLDHEHELKLTKLGATYDFGAVKLYASYDWYDFDEDHDKYKARAYILGAKVPVGMGAFTFEYGRWQDKSFDESDARGFHLGYQYYMSKRTTLYALFTRVSNDEFSGWGVNGVSEWSENARGLALGMRHSF